MAWFLSADSDVTGRVLLTGGGRLASLVFAEAGEILDVDLEAERVARDNAQVFDVTTLTVVNTQAGAGARYFRYFPWEDERAPDFGPDVACG